MKMKELKYYKPSKVFKIAHIIAWVSLVLAVVYFLIMTWKGQWIALIFWLVICFLAWQLWDTYNRYFPEMDNRYKSQD